MPYGIRKINKEYSVYNIDSGRIYSNHTSYTLAEAQLRLLRYIEHNTSLKKIPVR